MPSAYAVIAPSSQGCSHAMKAATARCIYAERPGVAQGRVIGLTRPSIAAQRGYGDQVACRMTELVLDARDPEVLARFWCEVLGYVELERVGADIEIGPPGVGFGGPQPTIVFNQSDEPKSGKLRLHIDVNATDREQDQELERLLAAGARRVDVGQTGAESWHVLADPEATNSAY